MTVKGSDDSKKDAVMRTGGEEESEQVPSYQEATSSSSQQQPPAANSSSAAASSTGKNAAQNQSSSVYPFPSMSLSSPQPGYGQSPYQADGTAAIVIMQGNSNTLLPLHATVTRRGPRAGRRFLAAFFWALILYMILAATTGALVQMQERAHQPRTPPGWKHHHDGPTQTQ